MKNNNDFASKLESDQFKETDTDSSPPCHKIKMPLWLVLLDNIPTLILFVLGAIIVYQLSVTGSIILILYSLFSVGWFWAKICPFCHHYDTFACPCGYGKISSKIFRKRTDKSFKKVFRRNLVVVFPNWFIPLAVAIYLLATCYTDVILILTIAFCLTGFVIIPLISKFVGCRNCEIKDDCPWMTVIEKGK